jgi:CspA family cold shock protein
VSSFRGAGTVRHFNADEGWGVIDGPDIPGGCWVPFWAIAGTGYRQLTAGRRVLFRAEPADQDGFAFRASRVWAEDADEPGDLGDLGNSESDGYQSSLTLRFDEPGE